MYKTLLDHRFAEEFKNLVAVRSALVNDVADEAQAFAPVRSARTGTRLTGIGLQGDTHPLQAEWLKFDQPRFCPSAVTPEHLTEPLRNRVKTFALLADEHVANRTKAKQLIAELEAAVWRRSLAQAWPEGAFAMTHRPVDVIISELNSVLRLS